jgi:hypothetical protein
MSYPYFASTSDAYEIWVVCEAARSRVAPVCINCIFEQIGNFISKHNRSKVQSNLKWHMILLTWCQCHLPILKILALSLSLCTSPLSRLLTT